MISSRGYTTGMFFGKHSDDDYNHKEEDIYRMSHELVGVVQEVQNGKAVVALRGGLKTGDRIEFLSQGLEHQVFEVISMHDMEEDPVDSARNEETILLPVQPGVKAQDLIRRPVTPSSP